MSKECNKKVKKTSIGGQAVLEGVMMKGEHSLATAVRTETGEITIESKRIKSAKERNAFFKLPFIRGVVNLVTQLFEGMKILMRSAEVYGDFAEPSPTEKKIAEKFKINPMNLVLGLSLVLGVALAIGLFVLLPNFLTGLIFKVPSLADSALRSLWYSLIEGGIMLAFFVVYILLVSLMKDIRRVFMYHGAEHKVINCYEYGFDLTVDNAKKMSRQHSRCGTTFLFLVVMVSIFTFAFINWGLEALGWLQPASSKGASIINALIKMPCKLLFVPVVAGVSYEILKFLAKFDALPARILRAPGMWLQKLTTREPDESMLEVSLTAFKTVLAMDADESIAEQKFDVKMPTPVARKRIEGVVEGIDESDIDWILTEVTGKKRSQLSAVSHLTAKEYENAMSIANKMKDGTPLQYALGNTDFYGIRISVTPAVLIPRPETEMLADVAIKLLNTKSCAVCTDICTGSGAIAIAVAKNTDASVRASDVSSSAITVAQANAISAGVKIDFAVGDLFEKCGDDNDVITINPPYIPTNDIDGLEKKVKDFEPRLALDGGEDGLDFYRRIAKEYESHLKRDGALILEFGIGQENDIAEIFAPKRVEIVKDLEGVSRIAIIKEP